MDDAEESEVNEAVQNSHSNLDSLASAASNQPAAAEALPLPRSHHAEKVRIESAPACPKLE